jgi:hypothetical protein
MMQAQLLPLLHFAYGLLTALTHKTHKHFTCISQYSHKIV